MPYILHTYNILRLTVSLLVPLLSLLAYTPVESMAANSMRDAVVRPQGIFAPINPSGPEAWPESEGLSTTQTTPTTPVAPVVTPTTGLMPVSPAPTAKPADTSPTSTAITPTPTEPVAPVATPTTTPTSPKEKTPVPTAPVATPTTVPTPAKPHTTDTTATKNSGITQSVAPPPRMQEEKEKEKEKETKNDSKKDTTPQAPIQRPIVYMDEEGNVIPKPTDPLSLVAEAEEAIENSEYIKALELLTEVKNLHNVPRKLKEKVLYLISDITAEIYEGRPFEGFSAIEASTSEAMNANLQSARVPDALFRLGMIHLHVGNILEAEGYFLALKHRFPHDVNVPVAFYNLGHTMLEQDMFEKSATIFRDILQEYSDSPAIKMTAIDLIKALVGLKDYDAAKAYATFVDRRWPRYYLEDPTFLMTLATLSYHFGDKQQTLELYWLLYNIIPQSEEAQIALPIIGDLYFELGKDADALEVFAEVQNRFPGTTQAGTALMRLAEKGIHDGPLTMDEMFSVFNDPGTPLPQLAYTSLQKEYPADAYTVQAMLKYALWQLWSRNYVDAMGTAADFIDLHPEHPDIELARDTIMQGFMADFKNSMLEENYGRILILWNGFPLVRQRYGPLDADMRNALARGHLERGETEKALELLAEFLKTPMDPQYSETAFALYFNTYLEQGNWNAILDLGETVATWDMPAPVRGQLDYAMALSSQNLNLTDKALTLWKPLAKNEYIPLYQRAYATYFLAKDAEKRRHLQEAYTLNKKALELFQQLQNERSNKADPERLKESMRALMDITEVANRIPEALDWVEQYNAFTPKNSPEYPGLRFREARLYRKLGNTEKAKSLLEIIVKEYTSSPFAAAAETELRTFEVSRDLRNFMPQ